MFTARWHHQQAEQNSSPSMRNGSLSPVPSSWHPIHASPSEDMWEMPSSSSSYDTIESPNRLHSNDNEENNFAAHQHDDDLTLHVPSTAIIRGDSQLQTRTSIQESRSNSGSNGGGMALSEKKCVFKDTTNTIRRANNSGSRTSTNITNGRIFLRRSNFY